MNHVPGFEGLRQSIGGVVIEPRHRDYDEARRVWNAAIDCRPAVIAQCTSPADVAAAIRFATDRGLEIAVRGGAHSMSGASVVDDGIVVDLSGLKQVTVDPASKRARGWRCAAQRYGRRHPSPWPGGSCRAGKPHRGRRAHDLGAGWAG